MSDRFLIGKTALVTGSTSGIGLGIAKSLALAGTNIVLNGFGSYEQAVAEIEIHGVKTLYQPADMRKPDEIRDMVSNVISQWGHIDILINNAGIQYVSPLEEFPTDKWDDIIAINLSSSFHTIRSVLPVMRAKNWGRIINIASVHGLVGSAYKSAYVAAKHGLVGLTKVTALETATTGITCNAICPGWVLTPLVQQQVDAKAQSLNISLEEAKRFLLSEKEPSMQFTTPDELGSLAVFLCSDAGKNIRGAAWNMDGGWAAQ